MNKQPLKVYIPAVTVFDMVSKHTCVAGENCTLQRVCVEHNEIVYYTVQNMIGNTVDVPAKVFTEFFTEAK